MTQIARTLSTGTPRRCGQALLQEVGFLRPGPAGDLAVLDLDDGASRPHAGMRLERPFVFGFDHARRRLERLVGIAVLLLDALAHRRLADVVVERGLVRERRRDARPLDFQLFGRLDRVPFLVGDHAEEALLPHHAGAGNVLDRALVDLHRHRAGDRRADHAAMHHARHLHVGAKVFLRKHLGRDVFALDRLADDFVLARFFRLRLAGSVERVAVLLVPVELDVEILAADQLRIGNALGLVVGGADHAIIDRKFLGRHRQQPGRHLDQHAARFRRRHAHLLAAVLNAGGAGGAALVHRRAGVAHDHLDGLERNVEFLRHDLADGDVQPVPHIHLAEESRYAAVGIDRDVGRQLIGCQRRLGALRISRLDRQHSVERDGGADRYDQGAAAEQDRAAGEGRSLFKFCHGALPQPIIVAARLTALRMLMCVPQRHFKPESASLISASLGFFLSRRKAAAVISQPLMQ